MILKSLKLLFLVSLSKGFHALVHNYLQNNNLFRSAMLMGKTIIDLAFLLVGILLIPVIVAVLIEPKLTIGSRQMSLSRKHIFCLILISVLSVGIGIYRHLNSTDPRTTTDRADFAANAKPISVTTNAEATSTNLITGKAQTPRRRESSADDENPSPIVDKSQSDEATE